MASGPMPRPSGRIDGPAAFQARFAVSRETVARLEVYAALLRRWQKTINLVAPSTVSDVWSRHFADSAQLWALGPAGGGDAGSLQGRTLHWLDIGSGAGFPGLVLAILGAETAQSRHTLIESDTRKAAFLREVARSTGVAVEILVQRIEVPRTPAKVTEVNCVTARALAPLPRLLELSAPFFRPDSVGLFLKGREFAAELQAATEDWAFAYDLFPSVTDADARIVRLTALSRRR